MSEVEQEGIRVEVEVEAPKDQYLIFSIDNESFGIDINYVIEIIGMELITAVPDLQPCIKGVINLRGRIIPVMDVRIRFHKDAQPYNDRTCIIVVEINGTYMGLIIDEVLEVMNIEQDRIMPPPKGGKESTSKHFIWGIVKTNDTMKLLIDGDKLLEKSE